MGLLGETRTLPAVSVSLASRGLPLFTLKTDPLPMSDGGSVSILLDQIRVNAITLHAAASKRIGRFGLTAGVGRDRYGVSTVYRMVSPDYSIDTGTEITAAANVHRRTAVGGASIALGRATLGVEAGSVFGGRDPTFVNTFGDQPLNRTRSFVTFGVRFAAGRTVDRGR